MSIRAFTFGAALGAALGWALDRFLGFDYAPIVIETRKPELDPSVLEEAHAYNEWRDKALSLTEVWLERDPILVRWLSHDQTPEDDAYQVSLLQAKRNLAIAAVQEEMVKEKRP